jgi:hypothetical protein
LPWTNVAAVIRSDYTFFLFNDLLLYASESIHAKCVRVPLPWSIHTAYVAPRWRSRYKLHRVIQLALTQLVDLTPILGGANPRAAAHIDSPGLPVRSRDCRAKSRPAHHQPAKVVRGHLQERAGRQGVAAPPHHVGSTAYRWRPARE